MKIAVFDVCGTLYKSNTTFDFLDCFFKDNQKYTKYRKLSENIFVLVCNHLLNKTFKIDIIRNIAISFLKGFSQKEMSHAAKLFVANNLMKSQVFNVHKLMKQYKDQGYEIILMSASLDFIIQEVHADLKSNKFHATKLEVIDAMHTGKIAFDMTSNKHKILKKEYKNIESLAVVTDNTSDIQLIKSASIRHVICWKNKHKKFWIDSDIKGLSFVDVNS